MSPDAMYNYVVAPAGYEMAWGDIPSATAGTAIVDDLTDTILLNDWLVDWAGEDDTVVLFLPLVNPLTGQVLPRERAHAIARVVLEHNQRRPNHPAYVLADDSTAHTCYSPRHRRRHPTHRRHHRPGPRRPCPRPHERLDRHCDYSRRHIRPPALTNLLYHHQQPDTPPSIPSQDQSPRLHQHHPVRRLIAAAALSLTPPPWIQHYTQNAITNLHNPRLELARINNNLGFNAITATPRTRLFNWSYSDLGNDDPRRILRVNLASTSEELTTFIGALEHAATTLTRHELTCGSKPNAARVKGTIGTVHNITASHQPFRSSHLHQLPSRPKKIVHIGPDPAGRQYCVPQMIAIGARNTHELLPDPS